MKRIQKDLSSKNFYLGSQLPQMAQFTEADNLNQFDKVYLVVQNSETVEPTKKSRWFT